MPQMSPLMWDHISLSIFILIITASMKIYFSTEVFNEKETKSMVLKENYKKSNTMAWVW